VKLDVVRPVSSSSIRVNNELVISSEFHKNTDIC
jgi:hypothetical protein